MSKQSGGIGALVVVAMVWLSGCSTGHKCGDNVCSGSETPTSCPQDCQCGNGILDSGEECDGSLLGGETCTGIGMERGPLGCTAQCTFDTSECGTSECGNGVIEAEEDCEAGMLDGATCDTLGFSQGDLACTDNCLFDFDSCCNDQCAGVDDTQCKNEDVLQGCVEHPAGCFVWEDSMDCSESGEFCDDESGAEAVCMCVDRCIEDAGRCDSGLAQLCETQDNGCLDWTTVADCGTTNDGCAVGPDGAVCVPLATGEDCSDPYPVVPGLNVIGWTASVLDFNSGDWPCGFAYDPDLVLEYTATTSGAVEYTMTKPDSYTFVVNVSDSTCGDANSFIDTAGTTSIACQSVYSGTEITDAFPVTAGETYYIYVGSSFSVGPPNPLILDIQEIDCAGFEATPMTYSPAVGTTTNSLRPTLEVELDTAVNTSVGTINVTGDMGTNLSYDLSAAPTAVTFSNFDQTMTITPAMPFQPGETITVTWTGLVDARCGNDVAAPTWSFEVIDPPCSPGNGGVVGSNVTNTASGLTLTSVYNVAADEDPTGWIYAGGTTTLSRINKSTGATENVATAASIGSSHLGYEMLIDGDDIYVVNEASATTGQIWRISTDGGDTWVVEDYASFATAPSSGIRGVTVYNGKIWMISFGSTPEIWSVDAGATTLPATATLESTVTNAGSCSGLAMDDDYFYTGCSTNDVLVRIDRTTYAAEEIFDGWDMSATLNQVFGDDIDGNGALDVLYVKAWYEQVHYVCTPGATNYYADTLIDISTTSNYGMGWDSAANVLYMYDDLDDELITID